MPPNVPAATLDGLSVFPLSLSTAFTQLQELAVAANEYPDGSSQRRVLISNGGDRTGILPRRRWRLTKRLTQAKLSALRDFYDARGGGAEPFIFYDAYGGVGIGNHDTSGVDADGRFLVNFVGDWKQELTVGRGNASVEMVELALAFGSGTLDFDAEEESGGLLAVGII